MVCQGAKATEADWLAARKGLQSLCDLDPQTLFVVETHDETLADTLAGTQRIIDDVERPNLRVNYQPTRDFLQRGYLECLDALFPSVAHLHWEQMAADGTSTYLEEPGVIDFASVLDFLRERNYAGSASVEYCWTPVEERRLDSAAKFLRGRMATTPTPAHAPHP